MRKRSVYTRKLLGLMAVTAGTVLTIPGTAASVFAQQFTPVTHLDLRVTSALLTQAATAGSQAAPQSAPADRSGA